VDIRPALILAPMSGVTSSSFRRLIKRLNPGAVGLVVSELVSVEGMVRSGRRTLEMLDFHPEEHPISLQIFGYDIENVCRAAQMVQERGADIVDINCGCPAPKVVRKGGGCELMRQPAHLARLIREVRRAVTIPLTIKIRSGWDDESLNAPEVARIAEAEGVDALAVHGRTRVQLYRGEADWRLVEQIAGSVKIPVMGSGDIRCAETAGERMCSGVSGLMIGRAVLANPLVFSDVAGGRLRQGRCEDWLLVRILEMYLELLR